MLSRVTTLPLSTTTSTRRANMSNNPFSDFPNSNPYYLSTQQMSSGSSQNPVFLPPIFLLVFSSIFVLLILASLPGQFVRISAIDTSKPEGVGEMCGSIVSLVLWPLINVAIALGAISMIRLTSYRSAMVAAILSVIPICSPCFVLGIPFGIWAIVVLNRPEVRRRFKG